MTATQVRPYNIHVRFMTATQVRPYNIHVRFMTAMSRRVGMCASWTSDPKITTIP